MTPEPRRFDDAPGAWPTVAVLACAMSFTNAGSWNSPFPAGASPVRDNVIASPGP